MTALYDPSHFEPLVETAWDDARVHDAIAAIVADADAAYGGDELWPADEWDAWTAPTPLTDLYVGAAGVVWALDALRRRGIETQIDLADAARRTLERFRAEPGFPTGIELPQPAESSLLDGETGVLLVAWRLARADDLGDALHARVLANVENEANELMWGSPGTMLAARAMLGWTGDKRWADAWRTSADELWSRRGDDGLWMQRLYGNTAQSLGAPHGVVGNVRVLLDGADLLTADRRDAVVEDTRRVLRENVVLEGGHATWPLGAGRALVGSDGETKLQWCGGAPGVVNAAYDYLDEDLLLPAAELVWTAGPHGLEKGAGICHGTAGNGYAFLKTFARTGDELWLDRARRFAMHALDQVERLRAKRGRGRYSLFTGDVGTALFAAACIDARADYPIVDFV